MACLECYKSFDGWSFDLSANFAFLPGPVNIWGSSMPLKSWNAHRRHFFTSLIIPKAWQDSGSWASMAFSAHDKRIWGALIRFAPGLEVAIASYAVRWWSVRALYVSEFEMLEFILNLLRWPSSWEDIVLQGFNYWWSHRNIHWLGVRWFIFADSIPPCQPRCRMQELELPDKLIKKHAGSVTPQNIGNPQDFTLNLILAIDVH